MKKVVSSCIYCGCGCLLNYHIDKNKIKKISGYKGDVMSEGVPCIKGLTINEVFDKNRITFPYVRKNGKLVKASWKEAIDVIYKKVNKTKPKDIFMNGSGKITNEDNFLLYKMGQTVFNTRNIDSCCGRICHISTIKAMTDCFGVTNLTDISKVDEIDTLLIVGSNPATNYPVFWNKILRRKKKLNVVSVQSLLNLSVRIGDIFLETEPGTEVALLNGISNYLITNNAFLEKSKNYSNFKKLKNVVKRYTPFYVSKICNIKKEDFVKACEVISKSKKLGVFHGMGLTQHINSVKNVHSFLNLALLKDADILVLRGEINVQGVGDVFSPNLELLKNEWAFKVKENNGNIIKSLILNPCKVAFLTEFNPAQSLPNLNVVHKNLEKMFIVYNGAYFNLTCDYADVILPIPALFESHGTITNGEQCIRLVNPVIKTKGKNFLEISKLISKKFKKENLFYYKNSKDIFNELLKVNDVYSVLDSKKIYSGEDGFIQQKPKHRKFYPEKFKFKDNNRSLDFPLLLTTFREGHRFLTSEITDESKTLTKLDKDRRYVFVNSKDADKFNVEDDDFVKVISKVGEITALIRISKKTPAGLIATRFHYKEMLVNKLFSSEFDKTTYQPNYKCCAVRIKKLE